MHSFVYVWPPCRQACHLQRSVKIRSIRILLCLSLLPRSCFGHVLFVITANWQFFARQSVALIGTGTLTCVPTALGCSSQDMLASGAFGLLGPTCRHQAKGHPRRFFECIGLSKFSEFLSAGSCPKETPGKTEDCYHSTPLSVCRMLSTPATSHVFEIKLELTHSKNFPHHCL